MLTIFQYTTLSSVVGILEHLKGQNIYEIGLLVQEAESQSILNSNLQIHCTKKNEETFNGKLYFFVQCFASGALRKLETFNTIVDITA